MRNALEDYKKELDDYVRDNNLGKKHYLHRLQNRYPPILSDLNLLIHASTDPGTLWLGNPGGDGDAQARLLLQSWEVLLKSSSRMKPECWSLRMSPESMADAIIYCLSNRDKARKMGERGRQRFIEMFSSDKMVVETEKVYEEVFQ